MRTIDDIETLQALYDAPAVNSLKKVTPRITPLYRRWIETSRFCILTTVGPEGTDATPRGDDGPVVRIVDKTTLWLPDWRGNNRLDSLRNIVRDSRVSLLFMVPGSNNVVRVNGTAVLTDDEAVTAQFDQQGKHPRSVTVITVGEMYFQCAKALMRSGLWSRDDAAGLPTAGQFVKEQVADFDADTYDTGYEDYARPRMW
ncbi:pyridoxamine 5'-phosphate oxidase family protein [Roseibacterium sp. SDUM158017]|uniref:pyridoxamine 5'-phosphate oxidase family protein n=1 Tax=Roseicyclus salinarum TaxID=3036773 RepID=UPI0024156C94|nr:pyridoxamine 5'-phosphate oxidase family protein [Roseibacterium sp. SDUM158017]MDG4648997.1 pyridoxamine 5'-phosphate oxidase family protein [Roseibacterium sp. SDUM158017]